MGKLGYAILQISLLAYIIVNAIAFTPSATIPRRLNGLKIRSPSRLFDQAGSDTETSIKTDVPALVASLSEGKLNSTVFEQKILEKDSAISAEKRAAMLDMDISTTIGGAAVGMVAGGLSDGAFFNGDAPWAPLAGPFLVGGLAYYLTTEQRDSQIGDIANSLLGQPVISLRKSVVSQVKQTTEDIQNQVTRKVDETVESITSIPSKTQKAIQTKVCKHINNKTRIILCNSR